MGISERAVNVKILTIHTGQIGNNLLLTPVFRALRKAYPEATISHLTSTTSAPIFYGNPDLDMVISLDKKSGLRAYASFLSGLRKGGWDIVLDFMGNPRTAVLTLSTRARQRLGYDYRLRQYCYTHIVKRRRGPAYAVDFNLDLLDPLGVPGQGRELTLVVPPEARKKAGEFINSLSPEGPIWTLSPVSRRVYKRWPEQRFSLLGDAIVRKYGARVVLLWGPGEEDVVGRISGNMREKSIIAPRTTLMEMAAIIACADLHIGNDNGPKHIAVAVGTPTVTIYGPTDPVSWTPPGDPRHIGVKKDAQCPKCVPGKCTTLTCLNLIEVGDVMRAVDEHCRSHIRRQGAVGP